MREGLITSYHKSLIKRPLWSRSIIRSLIRQTIFLEKIKDQGNIKEVIRKCALEGCAFVANPWAVRFPGFFFSSHWEFHEYRRVSPIFHPLWWFHAEFCVDGKEDTYTEERLSSKTIIVASIITIFSLLIWSSERIVEFRLITVLKVIWRIKKLVKGSKLLLELQKIETKILSNLYISANWNNLRSIVS